MYYFLNMLTIRAMTKPIPKPPIKPFVPKFITPSRGITVKPITTKMSGKIPKPKITDHPF
jgi:hypothetical protein